MSKIARVQSGKLCGLVDFWYARELSDISSPLTKHTEGAGAKFGKMPFGGAFAKALSILIYGRGYDFIVPNWYRWGRLVVVLNSIQPRPKPIILLEVIDYGVAARKNWSGAVYRLLSRFVIGPAMRRSVELLQVMTESERQRFISIYRLAPETVKCVPWPLVGWIGSQPAAENTESPEGYVFSSGRAACDWQNLFRAARDQSWKLVVVCSKSDLELVRSLNEDSRTIVFSEIPKAEHDSLLANARVCAVSLLEQHKSSGQVRLGAAIELEVAVVATAVEGLRDYLLPGVNALSVPPADYLALRAGIQRLLSDHELRRGLIKSARLSCDGYSKSMYFEGLQRSIVGLDLVAFPLRNHVRP